VKRVLSCLVVALSLSSVIAFPAAAASAPAPAAAEGKVTIFSHELAPLIVHEDPTGCTLILPTAHVLINQTDTTIRIYADPLCLSPSLTVPPGYGFHVSPSSGSFVPAAGNG
jgi:hypothetical protein